jgi:HD domain
MPESSLVEKARSWVVDNYPYNRDHLLRALEWVDRLAPDAREAVRLATLTHDMERAFPGPDSPVMSSLDDPVYERLHSERSARIVSGWLKANGAEEDLIRDVEALVLAHETGGSDEADLVQAADRLSFLETNIDLFLGFVRSGRFSIDDVRTKFEHSYHRIRVPDAKALALPLFKDADARLASLAMNQPRASA